MSSGSNNRIIFSLLFAYFAAQILLRVVVSDNVQLDESQQLLWAQEWHWGYGSQPPLYTWLQMAVFRLLGTNVFALALLKNLLLGGTYLLVFGCMKKITGERNDAAAAMSSLLLLPQIAWESQRDQSHSVLATMAAAATLYVFLCLGKARKPAGYALLGLCVAVGCLGKYSYALFPAGLFLSALTLAEFRPVVRSRWLFLSLGVFAAAMLPHAIWMRTHPAILLTESDILHSTYAASLWQAYREGLWSLVRSAGEFSGPALLIFAVLFFRPWRSATTDALDVILKRKLIERTVVIGLLICVALIFCCRARFRDRWMQQMLFVIPIYLVLFARRWQASGGWKRLFWLNGVVALGIVVGLPGGIRLNLLPGSTGNLTRPYPALAEQIKQRGFERGVICTPTRTLAGNLKMNFKDSKVIPPELAWFDAPRDAPWLAAWKISSDTETNVPPVLLDLVSKLRGDDLRGAHPVVVQSEGKPADAKTTRLAFIILPPIN